MGDDWWLLMFPPEIERIDTKNGRISKEPPLPNVSMLVFGGVIFGAFLKFFLVLGMFLIKLAKHE